MEIWNNKIHKIFTNDESITKITDYDVLCAEEILPEEMNINQTQAKIIHITHVDIALKSSIFQVFGNPFLFVVYQSETVEQFKKRIQLKLGLSSEEFSKWKIVIVSLNNKFYLEDGDIVLECSKFNQFDYLGLFHKQPLEFHKTTRHIEKAIKING